MTTEQKIEVIQAEDPTIRDRTTTQEDDKMAKLKTDVANGSYSVDSGRVAEEILRKVKLMKWARRELVSPAGPSPRIEGHGH